VICGGWGSAEMVQRIAAGLLGLALLLGLGANITTARQHITFKYTIDYAEGPLVGQVATLAAGGNIYRPPTASRPPYTISNYTPLYLLALARLHPSTGPAWWPGRLLSWLATLASSVAIGLITYTATRQRWAALAAGLLWLGVPYAAYWGSLYKTDPTALALSLWGLAVLIRWPRLWWLSGLLWVLAVFARQSYGLVGPLAGLVLLWQRSGPRHAIRLAGLMAGAGAALLLGWQVATGGGFWFNVVTANANKWHGATGANFWAELATLLPLLLAIGLVGLLRGPGWLRVWLLAALVPSVLIWKIGSNTNYFLELVAGLVLASGWLLGQARGRWAVGLPLLLAAQVVYWLPWWVAQVADLPARAVVAQVATELISTTPGQVLADQHMGAITTAGRPIYYQPFISTQLAEQGLWDLSPMATELARGQFGLVLVASEPGPEAQTDIIDQRWPPALLAALGAYKREVIIEQNHKLYIYRPAVPGGLWPEINTK